MSDKSFGKYDLLRQITQADVDRNGDTASVMVRGGLLLELLERHAELVSALEECQRALATMVEPNDIRTTTVMNAYALGKQAETSARTALSNVRGEAA